MAAPYSPANRAEDWVIRVNLMDMANPGSFKSSPTLASGDAKVSKDGGALANLNTLPAVDPAASAGVKITLSATEMTADNVSVQLIDQTNPKEWADLAFTIVTSGTGAYNPPNKGEAFITYIALTNNSAVGSYKAGPTIAAGDFKVDIDGGGFTNLATLPSVEPAASIWVKITLSTSEMNGDVILVQCIDQTDPKEWADYAFGIQTT